MIGVEKLTPKGAEQLLIFYQENKTVYRPIVGNFRKFDSTPINRPITIDPTLDFANKFELGEYLLDRFRPHSFNPDLLTWDWLSLIYFNKLLSRDEQIGQISKFMISHKPKDANKSPLLKGAYDFCFRYQDELEEIKFLLQDPINVNGSIYTLIYERKYLANNLNFLKFLNRFINNYNARAVDVDLLINRYNQYDRAYDMHSITPGQFSDMLKKDYPDWVVR